MNNIVSKIWITCGLDNDKIIKYQAISFPLKWLTVEVRFLMRSQFLCVNLRPYSDREKKIKEQAEKIREKSAIIKRNVRFRLVWIDLNR